MSEPPRSPPPVARVRRLARVTPEVVPLARPPVRRSRAPSPLLIVAGLLGLIGVGTLLLMLPIAGESGHGTDPLTALFTATSAACVTGLVVVDTQDHWSFFGEVVILLLIFVGGLGFLSSSTLLLLVIGRRLTLRDRLLAREAMGEGSLGNVPMLLQRIVRFALISQGAGAAVITLYFLTHEPPGVALWYGVFHSVSAFNNAGFDLLGGFRSLAGHRDEPLLLIPLSVLIVIGGLGYTVVADALRERGFTRLALDTKLVLVTSGLLLLVGTVVFFLLEVTNDRTLGALPLDSALAQALFYSVSPRTAGMASLDMAALRDDTLFFLSGLMFIGGAAGSTAGGIKVGTLAVLAAAVLSAGKGRARVVIFGRELPVTVVMRALAGATLGLVVVANVTLVLTVIEPFRFEALVFETTSAFGTVGLSTGITPSLSAAGKVIVILTMVVGRLGPLTLAFALTRREQEEHVRYPAETVRIG